MASADHYQVLGVDRSADTQAIKASFRRLAKQFHPDHNPRDPAAPTRFRQIVEAYDELVDHARRAAYDLTLRRSTPSAQARPSASTRYQPPQPGSRVEIAIKTFDRLAQIGWRENWQRHIHARLFLQAMDEVYELESLRSNRASQSAMTDAQRERIASSLDRFRAALVRWKSAKLFVHADKVLNAEIFADQSPSMFIVNPDETVVASRLEMAHASYASMPDPERHVDPDCAARAIFSLGDDTLAVLTPSLMRLKGLQNELDVFLMCAAFAKKHWMGRWSLNAAENPERLFRATVAAEIIGVKTISYEIPIDRREEADWIKRRAHKRARTPSRSGAASLAEERCSRTTRYLHYNMDRPDYTNFVMDVPVTSIKTLAGPVSELRRVIEGRPAGCRHLRFRMDYYA
jgi:hypothetical protein